MSRSTRTYVVVPRLMTHFDLAVYLRRSEGWLNENLPKLYEEGFPEPDRLFDRNGLFDGAAVDVWLDRRSNLLPPSGQAQGTASTLAEQHLLKRIEDVDL